MSKSSYLFAHGGGGGENEKALRKHKKGVFTIPIKKPNAVWGTADVSSSNSGVNLRQGRGYLQNGEEGKRKIREKLSLRPERGKPG